MRTTGDRRPHSLAGTLGLALAIVVVTVLVFLPALDNGFVDWDDELNFTTNLHYRGLGWSQLHWMLIRSGALGHWIPLTWLTFGADYVLWGMNPFGYHLTNVVLHAADAALVFVLARRLIAIAMQAEPAELSLGATTAALIFAIHPLRVESVAWITERRDGLSALFVLLSVLAYLRMVSEPARRRRWLGVSLVAFAAALLSKPLVMTLPIVLVILDAYPLRRLDSAPATWLGPSARRVWLEKLPYVAVAAAAAVISFRITVSVMPVVSVREYPIAARLLALGNTLSFYTVKTVLPTGLLPIHELPEDLGLGQPAFLAGTLFSAGLTIALMALRGRWPAGLAAWGAYAVMLLPVSGLLITLDPQIVADRYSYLACLGWAMVAGAGVITLRRRVDAGVVRPALGRAAAAIGVAWLLALAALTWQQTLVWRDSASLWGHAVAVSPECALCENRLGAALFNRRDLARALVHLERAAALRPDRPAYQRELGIALLWSNHPGEAVPRLTFALDRAPADADLRSSLGLALLWSGRLADAEAEFRQVLAHRKEHPDALAGLGMTLVASGRAAESVPVLEHAVAVRPGAPLARYGLARAYTALGRREAADAQVAVLRAVEPALAEQAGRR